LADLKNHSILCQSYVESGYEINGDDIRGLVATWEKLGLLKHESITVNQLLFDPLDRAYKINAVRVIGGLSCGTIYTAGMDGPRLIFYYNRVSKKYIATVKDN
jgi:hypothetical protein